MLAPQFSLRRLLSWVTISAFVCLIVAAAARGRLWAAGVMIGLAAMALILALHGLAFTIVKVIAAVRDRGRRPRNEPAQPAATPT
jgi:hypothetical protein